MMKILTGFAVIKDSVGHRITYTYTEVDEQGNILSSNKKASYIVLEEDTKNLIEQLEAKIEERLV
ncbi:hypothetical protein [Clostridium tertium]